MKHNVIIRHFGMPKITVVQKTKNNGYSAQPVLVRGSLIRTKVQTWTVHDGHRFGHELGRGLGQIHDFGHGHVRKSQTRTWTRTNFGYACPLNSVLKCIQRQADPMILVKNRLGKFYEQISWEIFTNVGNFY